jgi:hypothetical protein
MPTDDQLSQPVYYHCCPVLLGPGSVIEPGNWGRVIAKPPLDNIDLSVIREALLEQSRRLHAPEKPSRLSATFVIPNLHQAQAYRRQHGPSNALLYEVSLVDPHSKTHIGNYELAIFPIAGQCLQQLLDRAKEYWTVASDAHHEMIVSGPIRVLRRLA